jgi:hypothetical protein
MYEGTFPALLCHVSPAIFFPHILVNIDPIHTITPHKPALPPIPFPTPTDALEIVRLSGKGRSYEACTLVCFVRDWEGAGF